MDKDREINKDMNFGNSDFVSIKSNLIVKIEDNFIMEAPDGAYELRVKIIADLETVPEKYREAFVNVLTSKYLNKVSFTSNPFSACLEKKKKGFITKILDYLSSI